jgi:hypothetical protein
LQAHLCKQAAQNSFEQVGLIVTLKKIVGYLYPNFDDGEIASNLDNRVAGDLYPDFNANKIASNVDNKITKNWDNILRFLRILKDYSQPNGL